MSENYDIFRECLSNAIVARSEAPKVKRKKGKRNERGVTTAPAPAPERADPEELAEFVDFLASETFTTFPEPLQNLSYAALQHDPSLSIYVAPDSDTPLPRQTAEKICSPIPVSVSDSLAVYGIIPDAATFWISSPPCSRSTRPV